MNSTRRKQKLTTEFETQTKPETEAGNVLTPSGEQVSDSVQSHSILLCSLPLRNSPQAGREIIARATNCS
jgi:hypothetical protein